ncbi:MAG: hypothetical protein NVS4B2_18800 [Chloroflexota bacterium]
MAAITAAGRRLAVPVVYDGHPVISIACAQTPDWLWLACPPRSLLGANAPGGAGNEEAALQIFS